MQETLKTVKYSIRDDIKFGKIAVKLGRSKRQVLSQMIDYFYRSKKDPTDLNDELLKNTILKGQKEYIGFVRTQEADLLIPIKRDATSMVELLKRMAYSFDNQVMKYNEQVLSNQSDQRKGLSSVFETLGYIEKKIEAKALLKQKAMNILNRYIKERENLRLMSSAREKEELANTARKELELL
ncbi:BfmA/BtgA family mobilization protein [Pedobacter ureilyticus]|uniref:BfmA/BtgA family mobilization protein n=2 Tax=Pedobacter ureilyticus TaxID=1393051 RepID=A0ABW9JBW1_9SPHI